MSMYNILIRSKRAKLVKDEFNPEKEVYLIQEYRFLSKTWHVMEIRSDWGVTVGLFSHDYAYVEKRKIKWSDLFKIGNNKLPFAVFNMSSAHECEALLRGECKVGKKKCYAWRDENVHKFPLPYRRRQEVMWRNHDEYQLAAMFKTWMDGKTDTLRLNEAGEMRDEYDVMKANKIALFLSYYNMRVYTYSARRSMPWDKLNRDHITIIGSSLEGLDGQFIMVKDARKALKQARSLGIKAMICPSDCTKCDACPKNKEEQKIIFAQEH